MQLDSQREAITGNDIYAMNGNFGGKDVTDYAYSINIGY
jgi:hypothetical protein